MFSNKLSIDLSKRSRPSSRIRLLPEIVQTPKNNYGKNSEKINNSLTQRGLEIVQSQKLSLIDNSMGLNQFATQRNSEQAKKELIREIFKQERFQQNKSSLKQDNQLRQSYLVKFEEKVEDLQPKSIMKSESILKRKSSNSREHTDILDFFEMSEVDLSLPITSKYIIIQRRQCKSEKSFFQQINICQND
ncbi:hypothetical protein pb186bvf_001712 [Paramecium bursaria]